jgi:uncharacterized protein DUF4126
MTTAEMLLLLTQLAMGFALAACVGLRTFLPLLVAGLLARSGYLSLGDSFEWMATTPALIVFGSAVVFEVLADKVPFLDHGLHAVEMFAKPVAATILAASLLTNLDPVMAVALGMIGGGTVAGAVHVAKGTARLISSGVTGGLANPFLSLADDVVAAVGTLFAFVMPFLAALVVIAAAIALFFYLSRDRRRRSREAPAP